MITNLPISWNQKELKEVAIIERKNVKPENISGDTIFIGLEHMTSSGEFTNIETVQTGEIASNKFSFNSSHILYGKLRPYLRKITRPDFSGICSTDILPILPCSEIDRDYLYHYLRQQEYVDLATTRSSGANLPRISPKTLETFSISFPPLEEQKRIAAILDKADRVRRKRQEAIRLTEELGRSIFLDMFGDPVTNPKGWNFQKLGELLSESLQNGAYYPKEQYTNSSHGTEMVHMSDAFYEKVKRGMLKRVNIPQPDIAKYGLSSNDILIARRSLTYEGAAKPCLISESKEPLIFESSLIRVRVNQDLLDPVFFYFYLSLPSVRQIYLFPNVTKSTISGINQAGLKRVEIILPPIDIQRRFREVYGKVGELKIRYELEHLKESENLFNSLLQRAFRGEL